MGKAKVLTKDEIKRVMRIADIGNNGLRDRVALCLSIMAGMRIGEIAALKISDIRGIDGRAVEVINLSKHQTKGSKSRRVFISDELRKILNQYLAQISQLDDQMQSIQAMREEAALIKMENVMETLMQAQYRGEVLSEANRRVESATFKQVFNEVKKDQEL